MVPGSWTSETLTALDRLSGGKLRRRDDLGTLLGLGEPVQFRAHLEELSFQAKFLARAHAIMQRIGPGGEGYDRLAAEFAAALERSAARLRALVSCAPEAVRASFEERYLARTPDALGNFLALCHDLGWYKNWRLDAESSTL